MPLFPGARYRFKKTKHGKVRLAFRGNKVVEATPFKKGKQGKLVKASPAKRINEVANRTFA